MTQPEPLLEVDSLCKHFPTPRSERRKGIAVVHALCTASFTLRAGETVGVVGESGSGKSTLLRTILGLEKKTAGTVEFQGRQLTTFNDKATRDLRREISVVFQDPYSSLDPRMTVSDIISEPRRIHAGDTSAKAIADLLEMVELPRSAVERFPHEFSGGQRQRIAIARSLALNPKLIVLDEPVSALDVSVQATILDLLARLQRDQGVSYLLVSHDLAIVADIASWTCVMYGGQMVEAGPTKDVLRRPTHPYTKALLAAVPVPDPAIERAKVVSTQRAWPTDDDPLPPCPVGDQL